MTKSYNDISNEPINEAKLSRLNFYISVLGYLEEVASCFTELVTDNEYEEENEDNQEPPVSDLEEEIKK